MNPEEYKLIHIFIREVDKRFMNVENGVKEYRQLVKLNRDKYEDVASDLDEVIKVLDGHAKSLRKLVEADTQKKTVIAELKMEFDEFQDNLNSLKQVRSDLGNSDSEDGELVSAINDFVKSSGSEKTSTPTPPPIDDEEDDDEFVAVDDNTGNQKNAKIKSIPNNIPIYTRDQLESMDWQKMKILACKTYGCKKVTGNREFYVDWLLHMQKIRSDNDE